MANRYGVWGQKTMYGKKFEGIHRSAFLIDEAGKVIAAWYKISPQSTVPEALKVLYTATLIAPRDVIPAKAGIQDNTRKTLDSGSSPE